MDHVETDSQAGPMNAFGIDDTRGNAPSTLSTRRAAPSRHQEVPSLLLNFLNPPGNPSTSPLPHAERNSACTRACGPIAWYGARYPGFPEKKKWGVPPKKRSPAPSLAVRCVWLLLSPPYFQPNRRSAPPRPPIRTSPVSLLKSIHVAGGVRALLFWPRGAI